MSDSIWDDPTITAYVLGELPDEQRDEFENRLESDSDLAAAVEEVRSLTGQLEELYAAEPTTTLDSERRESIVTGQSASVYRERDSRSWRPALLIAATAAAILLLVGLAPLLRQQQLEFTVSQVDGSSSDPGVLESAATANSSGEAAADASGTARLRPSADRPLSSSALAPSPTGGTRSESVRNDSTVGMSGLSSAPVVVEAQPVETLGRSFAAAGEKPAGRLSLAPATPQDPNAAPRQTEQREALMADADSVDDLSQAIVEAPIEVAEAPIEMVPELGAIILRGSKRDVAKAKEVIDQVQLAEQLEGFSSLGEKSDLWATSPARAAPRTAGQAPAEHPRVAIAATPSVRVVEVAKNEPTLTTETMLFKQSAAPAPTSAAASSPAPAPVIRGRRAKEANVNPRFGAPRQTRSDALGVDGRRGWEMKVPDRYFVPDDSGRGPGIAGDRFDPITENPFRRVAEHNFSTFSVDVDTASYSKTRDYLTRARSLPRPDSVRIEELLNYFDYEYDPPAPGDKHPFAARATVTGCPWNKEHRLARIALKGKTMDRDELPPCNLVFLIDTSGSMNPPNKLPLVIEGMKMLVDQLRAQDRVAITVYAGSAGRVLDSVSAKKSKKIRKALTQLSSGGSTNGGAGIALAYQTAREHFIAEGVNRVILCTDGDFNVGLTGTDQLVRMVEQEAKGNIFLSVLGFGMGNHNDAMLEQISGRGNGNYAFIDTKAEAHKVLVDQTAGTLVTIAKDVKLQIEFNPTHVSSYRLIGYENRMLAKEDFINDKKDAGEIGAGHAVTALYEIVPAGVEADAAVPKVDESRYQTSPKRTAAADSDEIMTLRLLYKQPDSDVSIPPVEFHIADEGGSFEDADHDMRFAAAVASFGMQLRRSQYSGNWTISDVMAVAEDAKGEDEYGLRAEFVELVRTAGELMGQQ
jgi:Ca-activated chloride channel family protein